MKQTLSSKILEYNKKLSQVSLNMPNNYKIINPYNNELVNKVTNIFYNKYYNDNNKRRLILGSNPSRSKSAILGIPFEDALHLTKETGIIIDNKYISNTSSNFLEEVITKYGGYKKFYSHFYMNFIFPLGIVKINSKGNETNSNYYDNKSLQNTLYNFIINSLKNIIDLGIDTEICYCIGSGENYKFLLKINNEYHFFKHIIPLEHPRFIMQYNSKNKEYFLQKYLKELNR